LGLDCNRNENEIIYDAHLMRQLLTNTACHGLSMGS